MENIAADFPERETADFTEIYNSTYNDIFRYVLSKCRNINDIPDIMQNTYLNFYSRLKRGGEIKEPIKYLIQTAKRELYKTYGFWNLANQNVPVYSKHDSEDFDNIEFESELSFEVDEVNSLLCDEIWKYIKNLDILTYKIFILYFQYDEKIKDIAQNLKINESTVKNRLFRTLKQLKEKYNV
jgi:RNA polymerase sigma-70 factor (ECF subfamily)